MVCVNRVLRVHSILSRRSIDFIAWLIVHVLWCIVNANGHYGFSDMYQKRDRAVLASISSEGESSILLAYACKVPVRALAAGQAACCSEVISIIRVNLITNLVFELVVLNTGCAGSRAALSSRLLKHHNKCPGSSGNCWMFVPRGRATLASLFPLEVLSCNRCTARHF